MSLGNMSVPTFAVLMEVWASQPFPLLSWEIWATQLVDKNKTIFRYLVDSTINYTWPDAAQL